MVCQVRLCRLYGSVSNRRVLDLITEPNISLLEKLTATTGPNGSEDWFNCGIEGAGWTPPNLTIDQVVTKELSDAIAEKNSPFAACAPYVGNFYDAQGKYGSECREIICS